MIARPVTPVMSLTTRARREVHLLQGLLHEALAPLLTVPFKEVNHSADITGHVASSRR